MSAIKQKHKYILYIWSERLDRYVICREFNTLEKIKKWYVKAKEEKQKPYYLQNVYVRRYIPFSANLDKYYIRHTMEEITTTKLIDEVLE